MDRRTSSWSLQINSLLEARRAETEKRERRHKRWEEARQEALKQEPRPQGLAEQLRKLQEKDPTLEQTWKAARREPSTGSAGFFVREGLLYRTWTTPWQGEEATVKQPSATPRVQEGGPPPGPPHPNGWTHEAREDCEASPPTTTCVRGSIEDS